MGVRQVNWSVLAKFRKEIPKNVLRLPAIKQSNVPLIIKSITSQHARILDIGANDRSMLKHLKDRGAIYKSMDTDRTYKHDFYSLKEISGVYDIVLMLDVIEHLTFEEFLLYEKKVYSLLKPNGRLIIQTPNIFALGGNQFYDVTHKQFWPYYDLYALLRDCGFRTVSVFRLVSATTILSRFRQMFGFLFCSIFGNNLDYAPNILVIAKK